MDDAEEKRDWRGYAAWGSFLCGALSLVTDMAIEVSMEYAPKMPHSPWEVRYFLFTAPISFLGIVLGLLGKDTPRAAGLALSIGVFLRVLAAAVTI